jgi:hypothetical protein
MPIEKIKIISTNSNARTTRITDAETGEILRVADIVLRIENGQWVADIKGFAPEFDIEAKVGTYTRICAHCAKERDLVKGER